MIGEIRGGRVGAAASWILTQPLACAWKGAPMLILMAFALSRSRRQHPSRRTRGNATRHKGCVYSFLEACRSHNYARASNIWIFANSLWTNESRQAHNSPNNWSRFWNGTRGLTLRPLAEIRRVILKTGWPWTGTSTPSPWAATLSSWQLERFALSSRLSI